MRTLALAICLGLLAGAVSAQPRKVEIPRTEQTVGSWVLNCIIDPMTDAQACRMRHRLWVAEPQGSQPGLALEVLQRYDQLVPAITARDLSLSSALSGLMALTATAQLRFDGNPMIELPCSFEGMSVICVPAKSDAVASADQLVRARSVLVRFRVIGNLPLPVRDEPVALDLERTAEALVRYRMAGPAPDTTTTSIFQDMKGGAERLLRRLGVPGMDPSPPVPAK